MRIVVAGGTGFLGRHIVDALAADGHSVVVMSRSPGPGGAAGGGIRADVTDPRTLVGVLAGVDAVVGAVQFPGHPMEVPRRGLTYDRFDRFGTENLVAEAAEAGVSKYVYVSGAGADPASDKTWYRAKGRAESIVRDGGMDHAIVRPSWAYGPGDRALNRIAAIARWSPVVPRLGAGTQRIQPVLAADVGATIARVFERDAWGRVFELGGPDVMTMTEVIQTLARVLGKRRIVVPVPALLAKVGTVPLVALPRPPMTPAGVDFATQDGIVDTSAVRQVLGIHPVGLEEGLATYMKAS